MGHHEVDVERFLDGVHPPEIVSPARENGGVGKRVVDDICKLKWQGDGNVDKKEDLDQIPSLKEKINEKVVRENNCQKWRRWVDGPAIGISLSCLHILGRGGVAH